MAPKNKIPLNNAVINMCIQAYRHAIYNNTKGKIDKSQIKINMIFIKKYRKITELSTYKIVIYKNCTINNNKILSKIILNKEWL